jgi:hypothetical protein
MRKGNKEVDEQQKHKAKRRELNESEHEEAKCHAATFLFLASYRKQFMA